MSFRFSLPCRTDTVVRPQIMKSRVALSLWLNETWNWLSESTQVHLETTDSRQATRTGKRGWKSRLLKWSQHQHGKEHAYGHTGEEHADKPDVLAQIAICSAKNKSWCHDVRRTAESFLRKNRNASGLLSEVLRFLQTSPLNASDYKEHLFNLRPSRILYETSVQDKLTSLQAKLVSVFCNTGAGSKNRHVLLWKMRKRY